MSAPVNERLLRRDIHTISKYHQTDDLTSTKQKIPLHDGETCWLFPASNSAPPTVRNLLSSYIRKKVIGKERPQQDGRRGSLGSSFPHTEADSATTHGLISFVKNPIICYDMGKL